MWYNDGIMTTLIVILIILNIYILPLSNGSSELPIDTSEDILSEGISDPAWIAKGYWLTNPK